MVLEFAAFDYDTREPQSFDAGKKFYHADGTPLPHEVALSYKPTGVQMSEYDLNGWLSLYSAYSAGQGQGALVREVPTSGTPFIYPYMRDVLEPNTEYAVVMVSTSKDTDNGYFITRYVFSGGDALAFERLKITASEVESAMHGWQLMGARHKSDYKEVEYPQPMRWLQTTVNPLAKPKENESSHLFYQRSV
jgi:hypothetical protein